MKVVYQASSGFVHIGPDKPKAVTSSRYLCPGVRGDFDANGLLVGLEVWGDATGFTLEAS